LKPGSLNATLASGKVILCFSVGYDDNIIDAAKAVVAAGVTVVIFPRSQDSTLDPGNEILCIKVNYEVGTKILSYITKTRYVYTVLRLISAICQ